MGKQVEMKSRPGRGAIGQEVWALVRDCQLVLGGGDGTCTPLEEPNFTVSEGMSGPDLGHPGVPLSSLGWCINCIISWVTQIGYGSGPQTF